MTVSTRLIAGSSVFENCGPFVIVREETLNRLEESAEVMRESLGRASRASSLRELVEIMEGLPDGPSMDDAFTMIYENFFAEGVPEEDIDLDLPPPIGAYELLVERVFYDSWMEAYSHHLRLDSIDCYDDVGAIPELRPYLSFAFMGDGAGIEDIDGAMSALIDAGYVCARDDERIRHCFEDLMSDTYLRGLELRVTGSE